MRSASFRRRPPRVGNAARRTERQQLYRDLEDGCEGAVRLTDRPLGG